MNKLVLVLCVLVCFSAHAYASQEFWGHWSPDVIQKKSGDHYQANEWKFQVQSRKLSKFLSCVKEKYPNASVFLWGAGTDNISKPSSTVLKRAAICTSTLSASNCDGELKSTCP